MDRKPIKKEKDMKLEIGRNIKNKLESGQILCNWSGGASSAVACYIALECYPGQCTFIHMRTNIEHPDTYRFMFDFEQRFGVKIEQLQSEKFNTPEDVWDRFGGFNYATGAPCSSELKREVANKYRRGKHFWAQVFGFDADEKRRADNMWLNHPELNPVFPLVQNNLSKKDIFGVLKRIGLKPPESYKDFKNNNCLGDPDSEIGGCVQGGIGYWKRMLDIFPKKFHYMAAKEHEMTDRQGKPVTMLRNQANGRKGEPLFLLPHPKYPQYEDISVKEGLYKVESFECHGFCGTK